MAAMMLMPIMISQFDCFGLDISNCIHQKLASAYSYETSFYLIIFLYYRKTMKMCVCVCVYLKKYLLYICKNCFLVAEDDLFVGGFSTW